MRRQTVKGAYKGLFSLRIGDYRVIYTIAQKSVLVLRISHRKDVYDY
ncbi:MAG: type II toxin-antitoxin system RelE/ParE family toxin [Elusimicrobia bacterium]|nr:type II toxin-antitoxin system RelE/ParE family toxin [Elusimicrobiota bacterium]